MIIKTKGEYKSFIRELSTEIRERDSFKHSFEIWLEDNLYQGITLDLAILDDGQRIHAIKDADKKYFLGIKENCVCTYDVRLLEDGGLEMMEVMAFLTDKDDYNARHFDKVPDDVSSVFSSQIIRRRFDADDVEISKTDFYKSDCPIHDVYYEDKPALLRLLDSPEHKPILTDEKVDLPTIKDNTSLIHTERIEENPAIAITSSRYVREKYDQDETTISLGMVSTEWPENLRVQEEHRFAVSKNGKWETIEDSLYSGATLEDNIERVTDTWKNKIEQSMTKKYNLPQYDVLREKINKVNKEKTLEKIR